MEMRWIELPIKRKSVTPSQIKMYFSSHFSTEDCVVLEKLSKGFLPTRSTVASCTQEFMLKAALSSVSILTKHEITE